MARDMCRFYLAQGRSSYSTYTLCAPRKHRVRTYRAQVGGRGALPPSICSRDALPQPHIRQAICPRACVASGPPASSCPQDPPWTHTRIALRERGGLVLGRRVQGRWPQLALQTRDGGGRWRRRACTRSPAHQPCLFLEYEHWRPNIRAWIQHSNSKPSETKCACYFV